MDIREVTQKDVWEGFLEQCKEKSFLQSWNWGEFQALMRGKVWRLGLYNKANLVAVALVVRVQARRGTFLLVPHGPAFAESDSATAGKPAFAPSDSRGVMEDKLVVKQDVLSSLLEVLRNIAKAEKASFIRINPIWERNLENTKLFSDLGLKQAPSQMHPEASWKLDITVPEEELFSAMRKTTRYLVRQTQKNQDLVVRQSNNFQEVAEFAKLHERVSLRQEFTPFSKEYLENEFSSFAQDDQVRLFWAEYRGRVVAASFVVFWQDQAFYHHAISLPEYAKLSAPYAIQWEAIKEAKKRGCTLYDFWGYVDPKSKHPWAGPTLFKMGFGGKAHEYVKTQDLPLAFSYWPTAVFEMLRKRKRGL
jgi:peptidoglycan pentaglycine glycine transferase (the first glycine)